MLFKRGRGYLYTVSLLCSAAFIYMAISVFEVEVSALLESLFLIVGMVVVLIILAASVIFLKNLLSKNKNKASSR